MMGPVPTLANNRYPIVLSFAAKKPLSSLDVLLLDENVIYLDGWHWVPISHDVVRILLIA